MCAVCQGGPKLGLKRYLRPSLGIAVVGYLIITGAERRFAYPSLAFVQLPQFFEGLPDWILTTCSI